MDDGDGRDAPAVLDVVHEDDHLLAVNKPAGVVVHPTYKHAGGTLMNALRWHARGWPAGQRPSLVGRLDKLTSGLLIVAKTPAVHAALQRELASSRSEKDYLAVVYGRVNAARGVIDLGLGVDGNDRRRMVASAGAGLPSVTTFVRVARAGGLSLLRCRLVTGRRHQIRVHLAARGWPIVGDPVYLTAAANGTPRWSRIADAALADAGADVSAPGPPRAADRVHPSGHGRTHRARCAAARGHQDAAGRCRPRRALSSRCIGRYCRAIAILKRSSGEIR